MAPNPTVPVVTTTITAARPDTALPPEPPPRRRNYPALSLLSVLLLFSSSGLGIALFALTSVLSLEAGSTASRLVLLVVSYMSFMYTLLHLIGARREYPRYPGAPHIYGNHVYTMALLLARLAVPVWVAAVILTAFQVAQRKTFDTEDKFKGNIVWWNMVAAAVGLISSITTLFCIQSSHNPFATFIFSRRAYTRGRPPTTIGTDPADRSVSRSGPMAFLQRTATWNTADRFSEGNIWFDFQVMRPSSRTNRPASRELGFKRGQLRPPRTPLAEEDRHSLMQDSPRRAWRTTHPFRSSVPSAAVGPGPSSRWRETVSSMGSEAADWIPVTSASVESFSEPPSPITEEDEKDIETRETLVSPMSPPPVAMAWDPSRAPGQEGEAPEWNTSRPGGGLQRSVTNFSRKRAVSVRSTTAPSVH